MTHVPLSTQMESNCFGLVTFRIVITRHFLLFVKVAAGCFVLINMVCVCVYVFCLPNSLFLDYLKERRKSSEADKRKAMKM